MHSVSCTWLRCLKVPQRCEHYQSMSVGLIGLLSCSVDWAHAMGPVEHMAPETLRAVLQQPLSANESPISPAADMFSLGVLLKGLALGFLPFAYSKKRSCTLSPDTAVKRAKGIVKQHKQWRVCLAVPQSFLYFLNSVFATQHLWA